MNTGLYDYDEDSNTVYVLDTETTGLNGGPEDSVVDIGICKVNLRRGIVEDVYSQIIGYDVAAWSESKRKSWIFENSDLTIDMVAGGRPLNTVITEVAALVKNKNLTAYNMDFDLTKFLYRAPWNMDKLFVPCRDIMKAAMYVCKLPSHRYGEDYRFPKLDYAYATILEGDDPAGVHGKQDHRALSDARMASHLMIRMYRDGTYRL